MIATVSIQLNEDEVEDIRHLQDVMQKECPDRYSDYTIKDVIQFAANSRFDKSLQELTKFYEGELAKNKRPYESANSGRKSKQSSRL